MKASLSRLALALALCLALPPRLLHAQAPAPQTDATPDPTSWPKTTSQGGFTYTVYQPQLETWDGMTLNARAAVSVLPDGKTEPVYGTITLLAQATVDKEERQVNFDKIDVTSSTFPTLAEKDPYLAIFRSLVPAVLPAISLDQLESSVAAAEARSKPKTLRNDPPQILVTDHPTLLIPIDGQPRWAEVQGTGFQRMVNTRALVVRDTTGRIFVHVYDGYGYGSSLQGPWTPATSVPTGVTDALETLVKAQQVDLLAGQPDPDTQRSPTIAENGLPDLRFTTSPTELIVTSGTPRWAPIASTQLLALENSPAHVFKSLTDQMTYLLVSGRWFVAPTLTGPWAYVPGASLPKDFAAIPDASLQENVKASIPGTPQAAEARIANDIPTTTKIARTGTTLSPAPIIDGDPQLGAIDGTGLKYVVNSDTPILEVNPGDWFACQNGVWFEGGSAAGPWAVATRVPPEIYSIPPTSSLYYLTYVRVYRFDADYVWVGYTPGYYGAIDADDGTVVYGTGYDYTPYISDSCWFASPWTYGYGCNLAWTPWGGWGFGFGVGWAWDAPWGYWACCPPAPFWGPYWGYCYRWRYEPRGGPYVWGAHGWYPGLVHAYSARGPWAGRVHAAAAVGAPRPFSARYGAAYNSVTGARIVGDAHSLNSVAAFPRQQSELVYHTNPARGVATPTEAPRMFAGTDGHVYQRTETGGWRDVGAAREAPGAEAGRLNQEYHARESGNQRMQSYRSYGGESRGGSGVESRSEPASRGESGGGGGNRQQH